jgi:hypothetical protein
MSSPAPFAPIAELIERSVGVRHVYADAVRHGDTTPPAHCSGGLVALKWLATTKPLEVAEAVSDYFLR